jgi:hypothetical protein
MCVALKIPVPYVPLTFRGTMSQDFYFPRAPDNPNCLCQFFNIIPENIGHSRFSTGSVENDKIFNWNTVHRFDSIG